MSPLAAHTDVARCDGVQPTLSSAGQREERRPVGRSRPAGSRPALRSRRPGTPTLSRTSLPGCWLPGLRWCRCRAGAREWPHAAAPGVHPPRQRSPILERPGPCLLQRHHRIRPQTQIHGPAVDVEALRPRPADPPGRCGLDQQRQAVASASVAVSARSPDCPDETRVERPRSLHPAILSVIVSWDSHANGAGPARVADASAARLSARPYRNLILPRTPTVCCGAPSVLSRRVPSRRSPTPDPNS